MPEDQTKGFFFPLTGGNVSDIKAGKELITKTTFSEARLYLVMDKGYSCYEMIALCQEKGLEPVVPPKSNHKYPWDYNHILYMYRNEIERLFGRIKNYRRIATRYDKLARRYAGFVTLGLILRLLTAYVNTA